MHLRLFTGELGDGSAREASAKEPVEDGAPERRFGLFYLGQVNRYW